MFIKDLFKKHNISTENIPIELLDINTDKHLQDYTKAEQTKDKIIFKGNTGKNKIKTQNTIIIDLSNINNELLNEFKNNPQKENIQEYWEIVNTPVLSHTITNNSFTYNITYNALGGEVYRT